MVEANGLNIFKNRLDKHWCTRPFRFNYVSEAFEELCPDIQGSGLSGKHLAFRPVFIIGIIGRINDLFNLSDIFLAFIS